MKPFVLFTLIVVLCLPLRGQIVSYPVAGQDIHRGLDKSKLTVKVDFTTCSNVKIKINLGATNTPGVISYVTGSVAKTDGTAALSITESDVTNLSAPEFLIGNTTAGETITFTIERRANCGSANATKDNVTISGDGCGSVENNVSQNNYNLLSPALTLVPQTNMTGVSVGTSYNRTFSVANGGLGCLNKLGIWIVHPGAGARTNSLTLNSTVLTASYAMGDSIYYEVTGPVLGTDGKFCNSGTALVFTENFTALKCNATTRYGSAWYGHDHTTCASSTSSASFTMSNNTPNLAVTLPVPDHDYTFTGDSRKQTYRITNSGTGAAVNAKLLVRTFVPGSHSSHLGIDLSKAWEIRNSSGEVLGNAGNLTALINTTSTAFYDGSCVNRQSNSSFKSEASGELTGIIIPAGQYIEIDVWYSANNMGCSAVGICNQVGISWTSFNTSVQYQNQCATANYTENYKNHAHRSFAYFSNSVEIPTDILPESPFTMKMNIGLFRTINYTDGSGATYLSIPVAGSGIRPNASEVTYDVYTWPMALNSTNDSILIGPLNTNINFKEGVLYVPLIASCSGQNGVKTLRTHMKTRYSSRSPWIYLGCITSTTTLHCPGPCPKGGATPKKFTLQRINFGSPDNDNNHVADVGGTIDLSKVDDHHSVNGDTLLGTWFIKVHPNNESSDPFYMQKFKYVYIDFNLGAHAINGSLNALNEATIEIYPNANPLATPLTFTIDPTLFSSGGRFAKYEITSAHRGGDFQDNDSLVVRALFTTNQYNADRGNVNSSGNTMFVTSNEVYSTYLRKTSPQTAPVDGENYTCDHFNDYNQISHIYQSPYIPAGQVITGCTNNLTAQMRVYTRGQETAIIFPYEVRTFYWIDNMVIQLPPGVTYRSGSGKIVASRYNSLNVLLPEGDRSMNLPDSHVSQTGTTLTLSNLRTIYTTYGGSITPMDELEGIDFRFQVDPTCDAVNGTFTNSMYAQGIGNVTNTPLDYSNDVSSGSISSNSDGWRYTAPLPNLSGESTVTSTDGTGSWSVVLQNQSNTIAAPNSYLYVSPVNSFTDVEIRDNGNLLTPDANGFYALGSLAAVSTRSITITAKTNNCNIDSLAINYGWGCNGLPASFSDQTCTKRVWLKLRNHPTEIQLAIEKQPAPSKAFCSSDEIRFSINSALGAYADNPRFLVVPPAGISITSAEIEYPSGSGDWQSVTPTVAGGIYTYFVENHTAVTAKGLPGVATHPSANNRKANLRINYTTECGFVNNSKFMVSQQADRPCGIPVPPTLGYNNLARTNSVTLSGSMPEGSAELNISFSAPVQQCSNFTINATVSPIGAITEQGDKLLITIPDGLEYVAASFNSSSFTLAQEEPIAGVGKSKILEVLVPAGITVGSGISYSFALVPAAINNGCGLFEVLTDYVRTGAQFYCPTSGTTCEKGAESIIASNIQSLNITKSQVGITSMDPVTGSVFRPNATAQINITLFNNGTSNAPAGTVIEFFCGNSTTSFGSLTFPHEIAANDVATAQMSLSIPSDCENGEMVRAMVRPAGLVTQCVCDSTSVLANSPLPVTLQQFTAEISRRDAKIQWTTTGESRNTGFFVHWSQNGRDWKSLDFIPSRADGGSSDKALHYSYFHRNPKPGTHYYRLLQVDMDQTGTMSKMVALKVDYTKQITVSPNPTSDLVTLTGLTGHEEIRLINALGQSLLKVNSSAEVHELRLTNYPTGTYLIRVTDETGQSSTYKVVRK